MTSDRFAILRGGVPRDHELAAITAAIDELRSERARERSALGRPAWQRAMLLEATGEPTSVSPTDLEAMRS